MLSGPGTANEGWIEGFDHALPDANDATRSRVLGRLLFVSDHAWTASSDGKSFEFGATSDDWTAIGLNATGQHFRPLLVGRGKVTVTPDSTEADPFAWTDGLYIVRNDTSGGADELKGAYQLLVGPGSMSADSLAGAPGNATLAGADLIGAIPIGMIADPSGSGVTAAFTPTNIKLTTETTIDRSILAFAGTQSVAYEGSRFQFSLGGSDPKSAKELTIDETGSVALLDAATGKDSVTVTASFGTAQQVPLGGITPGLTSLVTTNVVGGLNVGDAFTFEGLVNPENVQNGVTYYVHSIVGPRTFEFSTAPDSPAVEGASADAGGYAVVGGKFRAGGFALSGQASVMFAFTGNAPGALPSQKNGWDLKVAGIFQGEFTASDTFGGSSQVIIGSSDFSVPGIEIAKDASGRVTIPDWAFTLNGDFQIGKSDGLGGVAPFLDIALSNLSVTNTFDPTTHLGTLKVDGTVGLSAAGWSKHFTATLGDGATHDGLVLTEDGLGKYTAQSFNASVIVTKDAPTKPSDNVTFADKLKLHDFTLTAIGSFDAAGRLQQIQATGKVSLAVGD